MIPLRGAREDTKKDWFNYSGRNRRFGRYVTLQVLLLTGRFFIKLFFHFVLFVVK